MPIFFRNPLLFHPLTKERRAINFGVEFWAVAEEPASLQPQMKASPSDQYSEEAIDILALTYISGLGDILIKQLVAYCGSAAEVLKAKKSQLEKIPGIGQSLILNIENEKKQAKSAASSELINLEKVGGEMFTYLDRSYPSRLKAIPDSPCVLFGKGQFKFEHPRTLAIVGTRQATPYGKQAIEQFLFELKPYNPLIVSGLAYGIDIAAHKTSLQMGFENWAIMATGVDSVYPSAHKSVAEQIAMNGGVLTENKLGTKPDAPRFPARNRIIAGLADAIWVVEAIEKGGALITARLGNDYFKDVFALPGTIYHKASVGCNSLIQRNMAAIANSGTQLAESLGWELDNSSSKTRKLPVNRPADLSPEDNQVLNLMEQMGDIQMDEIAWRTQIPINELASKLLNLEFIGLVKSMPGKKFGKA